jgi:hypothetical protein
MDISKKIEELMKDQEFVKSLVSMETVEDIAEAFHQKGVNITPEELEQARQIALSSEDGELSEESLSAVSGGLALSAVIVGGLLIWTGLSVAGGALAAFRSKCRP